MKKIASIFLATSFLFGLSNITAFALSVPQGWTPETCLANVEYQYEEQTQMRCVCPTGSTNQVRSSTASSYGTTIHRFICSTSGFVVGPTTHTNNTCTVNVEYTYVPYSGTKCTCPAGSTYANRATVGGFNTGTITFVCQSVAPTIPVCLQAQPGMYYPANAVQCKCPNGTIVWSNSGYTSQCNWNTNPTIQTCQREVPGMSYITLAVQCKCPDTTVVWSNNGYTSQCNWSAQPPCTGVYPNFCTGATVNCWDGSSAANQTMCPGYKFCPNDNVTKRSLSYQCPVQTQTCWNGTTIPVTQTCPAQTQTCWNGSVVSIYQTCPVQQPTCSYNQYWNGYQCVNTYQPQQPSYPCILLADIFGNSVCNNNSYPYYNYDQYDYSDYFNWGWNNWMY